MWRKIGNAGRQGEIEVTLSCLRIQYGNRRGVSSMLPPSAVLLLGRLVYSPPACVIPGLLQQIHTHAGPFDALLLVVPLILFPSSTVKLRRRSRR